MMFAKLFDWAYRILCDTLARRLADDLAEASGYPVEPEPSLLLADDSKKKGRNPRKSR